MESKVVSLEVIPGHPKFIRLPSLSRSLIHSILPKACQEMHAHPSIFAIVNKPTHLSGPPPLSTSKKITKKLFSNTISAPTNIRPCTSSYSYKKMYQTQSPPKRIVKHYFTPKGNKLEKITLSKMYYCEVASPRIKKKEEKNDRKLLNTTNIVFSNENPDNLHNIPEVHSSMESSEFTIDSLKSLTLMTNN